MQNIQKMATPDTSQVSSLPLPPVQYINNFTDDNIKRGRAPKPPPPITDSYTMFGNQYNADDSIIRPLESQGIKRLYPQHFDRRRELRKLNHSLLVNFLDLIDLLVQSPDSPRRTEKVEDLSLLFIHIHHLLNEFRPHQARETLRVMMEMQRRQTLEAVNRFQKHYDKVMDILNEAIQMPPGANLDNKLLARTEFFEETKTDDKDTETPDACSPQDQLMCSIIDAMQ